MRRWAKRLSLPILMRRPFALLALFAVAAVAAEPSRPVELTLAQAVQQALVRHERAAIAATRRERAFADARADLARALPTVDLSASMVRRDHARSDDDALQAGGRVEVPLVEAGRWATARASGRAAGAVEALAVEERRQLAFDAARAYLDLLAAIRVRAAAEARMRVAGESLRLAEARREAGIIDPTAAARIELERATARIGLTRTIQAAVVAREALVQLVPGSGDQAADPEVLVREPPVLLTPAVDPAAEVAPLVAEAEATRPDLRALNLAAEARHVAAREPAWDWAPRLSAFGERVYGNDAALGRGDDHDAWAVGLEATWRVWDSGERGARRRSLLAQAREAALTADGARRVLASQLRAALATLGAAADALDQATVQARIADELQRAIEARFAQGLATALESVDAAAQAFAAAADLARARVDVRRAELALAQSLGRWPTEAR